MINCIINYNVACDVYVMLEQDVVLFDGDRDLLQKNSRSDRYPLIDWCYVVIWEYCVPEEMLAFYVEEWNIDQYQYRLLKCNLTIETVYIREKGFLVFVN